MTSSAYAPATPAPAPSLAFDDQLCFALYAASRALTARYRPLLDELGLTFPQWLVMLLLWEDSPMTVGQLGRRLLLDSGTLSPLLSRMEAAGLVTRSRSQVDERTVEIRPTEAGTALRERALDVPPIICEATGMSDEARDELNIVLRSLTSTLTAL
jgi:MarR family transcriptional regulator, organic hydroperoxide resistance regulator